MCGICGVFRLDGGPVEVGAMRAALQHRGPDDEGEYLEPGLGFGFRRLSILDLERGHQPMSTEDGRFTIVFNGEVYNHLELRKNLPGVAWKSHSDTETILRLFAKEGKAAAGRLNGMFAFAVWDKARRELTLARDPVGVKPLYYSFDGKKLAFSSELRSLLAGGASPELDPAGVMDYLSYGKVHAPRTILRDVLKLPAGTTLTLNDEGLTLDTYWRIPAGKPKPMKLAEAVDELDRLLTAAVQGNMLSDVPVGAFLSGGVDSSLVAALMAKKGKVQTFSVGFTGAPGGVDESAWAREAAKHLGTEHHELMLPAGVLNNLDESIALLDEPIADSAILPVFLLSKEARKRVKVVLTGEGADELFAGYNRYKAAWLNQGLKKLPGAVRKLAAPIARRMGKGLVFERLPFDGAREWADATASATREQLKPWLQSGFWEKAQHADSLDWLKDFGEMEHLNDALAFDLRTVLADSLLMKADKSTMRASLEARVPFLDKNVIEFAAGLPASHKIRFFKGKYLLRLVAQRYLPKNLVWRRKHGFIVPWENWVRDPKNPAVHSVLSEDFGLFDRAALRGFHEALCAGSRDVEAGLFFRIVVLGLWLQSVRSCSKV
jgi:asparagine synthase (glutamine-hydrolysing)